MVTSKKNLPKKELVNSFYIILDKIFLGKIFNANNLVCKEITKPSAYKIVTFLKEKNWILPNSKPFKLNEKQIIDDVYAEPILLRDLMLNSRAFITIQKNNPNIRAIGKYKQEHIFFAETLKFFKGNIKL